MYYQSLIQPKWDTEHDINLGSLCRYYEQSMHKLCIKSVYSVKEKVNVSQQIWGFQNQGLPMLIKSCSPISLKVTKILTFQLRILNKSLQMKVYLYKY